MSGIKYFALSHKNPKHTLPGIPEDAYVNSVWMDGDVVENCIFGASFWLKKPFEAEGMMAHPDSEEIIGIISVDPDTPEDLFGEIEIQIENDIITVNKTSFLYIPKGVAHGNIKVKRLDKPVMFYVTHTYATYYKAEPAVAKDPVGAHTEALIEGYVRPDGTWPVAPEGFLTPVLYIDGLKRQGAPYFEMLWFRKTNDTGPAPHTHDTFEEYVGFLGGDPENPDELGAQIDFYLDDEKISVTNSCLIFIPRGVKHGPLYVPRLDRPIIHFSGGNGAAYTSTEK